MLHELLYNDRAAGFCDRFVHLFVLLDIARQNQKSLHCFWRKNYACRGHFLDVFEPIEDVIFLNYPLNITKFKKVPWKNIYKINFWKDLVLKKSIEKEIYDFKKFLNFDYIAVHVRRTDKMDPKLKIKNVTTDEQFFKFIDDNKKNKKIFLATDNSDTQKNFKKRYGNDLVFYSNIIDVKGNTRNTSFAHSIIDFYLCINSQNFLGSHYSWWYFFINKIRENRFKNL